MHIENRKRKNGIPKKIKDLPLQQRNEPLP